MIRTIRVGDREAVDIADRAFDLRCFDLANGFAGSPMPATKAGQIMADPLNISKSGRLYFTDEGPRGPRYVLSVHGNPWYEFLTFTITRAPESFLRAHMPCEGCGGMPCMEGCGTASHVV